MAKSYDVILEVIEDKLENPEVYKSVKQFQKGLRDGTFPRGIVDAVFQPYGNSKTISLTDSYIFGRIWTARKSGEMLIGLIDMGEAPNGNNQMQTNNQILQKALESPRLKPYQLRGILNGEAGAPEDGFLFWDAPLPMFADNGDIVEFQPYNAPIEVGYTQATTTIEHLTHYRTLARWAYGSTDMYVFAGVNNWFIPKSDEWSEMFKRLVRDLGLSKDDNTPRLTQPPLF